MEEIFDEIFSNPELVNEPPVLIDIGASYGVVKDWLQIAKYCKCIAFDADDREFNYINSEKSIFKELLIFNCLVTDTQYEQIDFYLTKYPACSSLLEPDKFHLSDWEFFDLFTVDNKIKLKAKNINSLLKELNITKVDWFKTDSQGTDLRLFSCLGDDLCNKTIIVEFEPGIIDAYKGEDKLYSVLNYMQDKPFWVCDLDILGSRRINKNIVSKYQLLNYITKIKTSPGWGNISLINSFKNNSTNNNRDYLLGWVFSTIKNQHGFALELADQGLEKFHHELYKKLINFSLNEIMKDKVNTLPEKKTFSRRTKNKIKRIIIRLLD
jgi:hypothetical protein